MSDPTGPSRSSGDPGDEPPTDIAFARRWERALRRVSFVPHRASRTTIPLLASLARALAEAVTAEPFDRQVGHRVGAAMVAAEMFAPAALGASVTLLHRRLLVAFAIEPTEAADDRVGDLLGAFSQGFSEALRNLALNDTDTTHRAPRARIWDAAARQHDRSQHDLLHNELTGLPNRDRLVRQLANILAHARAGDRIGVCALDVERFADLNDAFGPAWGNAVLREMARRLQHLGVDHGYYVAHLGADRFVLVAQHTRATDDVVKIFDRAKHELSQPMRLHGSPIHLHLNAGLVERATGGADPDDLLHSADMALRWAKHDQDTDWVEFDNARQDSDRRRHQLTNDLRAAVDRDQLSTAYQPIVSLLDGTVYGLEALTRWIHPLYDRVDPVELIYLAERSHQLPALFARMLRHACRQATTWQRGAAPVVLSVNLAPSQLRQPDLVATVEATLDQTGLPARLLQLELTENAPIDPRDRAVLDRLSRLGLKLALDDFGSGYANLATVLDGPFETLKIDRSLVRNVGAGSAAARSAEAALPVLVELGHRLGMTVVAEGVEHADQAAKLRDYGCDLGQGYHLGRPTTANRIATLIAGDEPGSTPSDQD